MVEYIGRGKGRYKQGSREGGNEREGQIGKGKGTWESGSGEATGKGERKEMASPVRMCSFAGLGGEAARSAALRDGAKRRPPSGERAIPQIQFSRKQAV